ncbi:kelch repeat-containing protein [Maricaulis sp.]|uniref:Kelch repeat-containing protein n=1 Tax=Maricaulis sp. TaxID=1486257 RepID=UPI001B0E5C4D|nr:kelch repeat-containing protein [Maricaulis sp.]MBO6796003.1 galactose oxidase [Maricaulis sp.]
MILYLLTALTLTVQDDAWARLPEPVTNNAVAGVELDGQLMAYSFAGLHEGKTWRDVTADAYACNLTVRTCREIDGLPDGIGRLASVAVTVRGQIYIFGGYTVAEDHSERSTPEVWRFDPASETYTHITDIPVPVDDTVALVHQDRYIYLVSGWHDTDNVDLVQVYDVEEDRWFEATPFPGAPVFGHAGALLGQDSRFQAQMLVCGGTAVFPPESDGARRSFRAISDCWAGVIVDAPEVIQWGNVGELPGGSFYRGAATTFETHFVSFWAGTDNAFNFNGIGYNQAPSEPRADAQGGLFRNAFEGSCREWTNASPVVWRAPRWTTMPTAPAIMDIRGIIAFDPQNAFILGGMMQGQVVTDGVTKLPTLDDLDTIIISGCH